MSVWKEVRPSCPGACRNSHTCRGDDKKKNTHVTVSQTRLLRTWLELWDDGLCVHSLGLIHFYRLPALWVKHDLKNLSLSLLIG